MVVISYLAGLIVVGGIPLAILESLYKRGRHWKQAVCLGLMAAALILVAGDLTARVGTADKYSTPFYENVWPVSFYVASCITLAALVFAYQNKANTKIPKS